MTDKTRSHAAKQRIYEQFARIGKALAAPARLELLDLLHQGERSVDALAARAELSVANASQHLQVLAAARLVETRRDGQRILYRVADDSVEALWHALRRTAEAQLAELDRGRARLPRPGETSSSRSIGSSWRVAFGPARSRCSTCARPRSSSRGTSPGAISVPLDRDARVGAKRAPRRRLIVAYCRGPYCVYAVQAVAALRKRGLEAMRFEDGVSEWRAAGLPVERSAA